MQHHDVLNVLDINDLLWLRPSVTHGQHLGFSSSGALLKSVCWSMLLISQIAKNLFRLCPTCFHMFPEKSACRQHVNLFFRLYCISPIFFGPLKWCPVLFLSLPVYEAGTGYNNIDLEACREKGIAICNVPEYTTEAMGDYAITLVMALSCSLAPQMKALAKGDRTYMHQCHLGHLDHFEIRGKTYGILGGLGYIASNISKKALGLGMKVIVSDMPSTPLGMRDTGVEVVSFDDLLQQSDFISPMVPLNKHTVGRAAQSGCSTPEIKPFSWYQVSI